MGYLSSVIGESKVTLKKLNPARWAGRLTSLMGVKHRYCDVLKALTRIILEHRSAAEREEAFRLRNALQSFEFVLLVVVLTKVMSAVNAASIYLQSKDVDLLTAAEKLKTCHLIVNNFLMQLRKPKKSAVSGGLKECSKISVWARRNGTLMSCVKTLDSTTLSIASEFQFSTV